MLRTQGTVTVKLTALLIILITISSWLTPAFADDGATQASTLRHGSDVALDLALKESTFGGSAAQLSSTVAAPFDISYFLVVLIGLAGLIWVRRHTQSL